MGGLFEKARSFFEFFVPKKTGLPAHPPGGKPGLPAKRAEESKGIFAPGSKLPVPRFFEFLIPKLDVFKPGAPAPVSRIMESLVPEIEVFKPPARPPSESRAIIVPPPPEEREQEEPVEGFFAPSRAPEPAAPPPPEEEYVSRRRILPEDWRSEYPDIAESTGGREPFWVVYDYGWVMPTTYELAQNLPRLLDLTAIFEDVLGIIDTPWWQDAVYETSQLGGQARYEVAEIGIPGDPYSNIGRFFGVSDALIELYATEYMGADYFWQDILRPFMVRFTKAMDVLKPRGLGGWFEIDQTPKGMLVIVYKETERQRPHWR